VLRKRVRAGDRKSRSLIYPGMKALLTSLIVCGSAGLAAADGLTPMDVSASSTLKPKKDQYAPWRALDPSTGTGWCEGKKDSGVGEWLEISGDDLALSRLSVAAGYWKTDKLFVANNRPTLLSVIVTDHDGREHPYDLAVPDDMQTAELDLGETLDARSIRIVFADVARGKLNDTCISDVVLWNGDRPRRAFLEAPAAIDDLGLAIDHLAEAFGTCDEGLLKANVKFPLVYGKKKYKKPKDVAKACGKSSFPVPEGGFDPEAVSADGPGRVSLMVGTDTWILEYDGTRWKLVKATF